MLSIYRAGLYAPYYLIINPRSPGNVTHEIRNRMTTASETTVTGQIPSKYLEQCWPKVHEECFKNTIIKGVWATQVNLNKWSLERDLRSVFLYKRYMLNANYDYAIATLTWRAHQKHQVIITVTSWRIKSPASRLLISGADQRKHQRSASPAFVRGFQRWPVNSPHKWPVTRKMFPFDDVIIDEE